MQHMPPKPAGLLDFSDPRDHGDGTVSFQLRRQDGESLAVSCPIPHLANIINYFCQLARLVSEEEATELVRGGSPSLVPTPIDGLGIGTGPDPDQTVFVAKLGGFHLALSMPNSKLAEFGHALAATVTALSASTERKN
jgi:hypothetical protein